MKTRQRHKEQHVSQEKIGSTSNAKSFDNKRSTDLEQKVKEKFKELCAKLEYVDEIEVLLTIKEKSIQYLEELKNNNQKKLNDENKITLGDLLKSLELQTNGHQRTKKELEKSRNLLSNLIKDDPALQYSACELELKNIQKSIDSLEKNSTSFHINLFIPSEETLTNEIQSSTQRITKLKAKSGFYGNAIKDGGQTDKAIRSQKAHIRLCNLKIAITKIEQEKISTIPNIFAEEVKKLKEKEISLREKLVKLKEENNKEYDKSALSVNDLFAQASAPPLIELPSINMIGLTENNVLVESTNVMDQDWRPFEYKLNSQYFTNSQNVVPFNPDKPYLAPQPLWVQSVGRITQEWLARRSSYQHLIDDLWSKQNNLTKAAVAGLVFFVGIRMVLGLCNLFTGKHGSDISIGKECSSLFSIKLDIISNSSIQK